MRSSHPEKEKTFQMEPDCWINIEFGNPELTTERLNKAISACYKVHTWTLGAINSYWVRHLEMPHYRDFRPTLSRYILNNQLMRETQRYSLHRAAEKTFPYVTSRIKVDGELNVVLPLPIPLGKYKDIQISSRKVWKKYLASGGGITTTYGVIFPADNWKIVMRQQVGDSMLSVVPYLWHSITVWNSDSGWKMKFNLHNPESKYGRQAKKEERSERSLP